MFIKMFTIPRVCHVRYNKDKKIVRKSNCSDYRRIVTVVWNFYPKKNLLIYGATIYTPAGKTDRWVKKDHEIKAQARYKNTPVMIKLVENYLYFSRLAMDRYIANYLVYRFGVKSKVLDYVHHFTNKVNIVKKYDPEYHILIRDQCKKEEEEVCNIGKYYWSAAIILTATLWGCVMTV